MSKQEAVDDVILVGAMVFTLTHAVVRRAFRALPTVSLGRSKSALRSPMMIRAPKGRTSLTREFMLTNQLAGALGGLYTPNTTTGLFTPWIWIFVIVHSSLSATARSCRSLRIVGFKYVLTYDMTPPPLPLRSSLFIVYPFIVNALVDAIGSSLDSVKTTT